MLQIFYLQAFRAQENIIYVGLVIIDDIHYNNNNNNNIAFCPKQVGVG
jgi:hypothetical protein